MKTDEATCLQSLEARDIRPTALRLLILRTMHDFERAFSLADLATFSTAIGVNGMMVRNTSSSINSGVPPE